MTPKRHKLLLLGSFVLAGACGGMNDAPAQNDAFQVEELARFEEPWAMSFLPDGRLLVSEKPGALQLFDPQTRQSMAVSGVPDVEYGGQGGFGDVVPHPDFANNRLVYLSYAEPGEGRNAGAAVARAELREEGGSVSLENLEVIWRQQPKVGGRGHYGHRIAFGPDGYLWISSGERQEMEPAQDIMQSLGKIIRLNPDGSVPEDNPWAEQGGIAAQFWSMGHRNPLGLAFDGQGQLWSVEMGPRGGDELNRVERGGNYGWPVVSNGNHYSGGNIPDHGSRPGFNAPALFWNPVISPSSLIFYDGGEFPQWRGNAFIGGLSSQSLVRVEIGEDGAREAQRFDMGQRIREVEQGPDGALWLLEDGRGGLLRLNAADGGSP